MFESIFFNFGGRNELLIGISLSVLYITYYLVEAVKKPTIICAEGEFKKFLESSVPLLREYYWPTWWCVEGRLQTVVGSLLRSARLPRAEYRRQVLRLADGGQLALDWADCEGARAVLLVAPGLTGTAHADYVRCVAAAAQRLPATLVVYHNRGLGDLPLTTPRLYSALSHDDLAQAAAAAGAVAAALGVPLLGVGVSLGGLILGHHLAEAGDRSPVAAALLISSPLDVERGAASIDEWPLNRLLSLHMARALRRTLAQHAAALAGAAAAWDRAAVDACTSVRQFDAAFTARQFGFASVAEYYRAASLRGRLRAVRRPLLALLAADDPFQPAGVVPAREARDSPHAALALTARGGHIGWLEGTRPAAPPPHAHYMARLTLQYFDALLRRPDLLPPLAAPATLPLPPLAAPATPPLPPLAAPATPATPPLPPLAAPATLPLPPLAAPATPPLPPLAAPATPATPPLPPLAAPATPPLPPLAAPATPTLPPCHM